MKKKLLALCDPEKDFAGRFTDYFGRHRDFPCEVRVFTSAEALIAFADRAAIDILLINESLLSDEVRRIAAGHTLLLTEQRNGSSDAIGKYQSAPAILRAALAACPDSPAGETSPQLRPPTKTLVVYSPLGRCGRTTFALTLGQLLSRDHPTLFVSLEENASLSGLLHAETSATLADMIFSCRQREKDFISSVAGAAVPLGGLQVLMPTPCPEELYTVRREEWEDFFTKLERDGSYEYLVVDAGCGAGALRTVLGRADVIFFPLLTDDFSRAKTEAFRRRLALWDDPSVGERIFPLILPACRVPETTDRYFERLTAMPFGDYVREVIRTSGVTGPSVQSSPIPRSNGFSP